MGRSRIYVDGSGVKGTGHSVVPLEQGPLQRQSHHGRAVSAGDGKTLAYRPKYRGMALSTRQAKVREHRKSLRALEQQIQIVQTRMVELGWDPDTDEVR